MLEMLNIFFINEKKFFENFFIDIFDKLVYIFFQDNLLVERVLDERNNRVGFVLICLVYIVCVSLVCEKKVLFVFCQLIKVRNVEIEKIKMVNIFDLF